MAYYEDLNVDQGADATFEVQLYNADGSKRNLTDVAVEANLNRSYDADSAEAISFTTNVTSPINGVFNFALTNQQTTSLNYKKTYVYDVYLAYDDLGTIKKERIMEGKVYVSPSAK